MIKLAEQTKNYILDSIMTQERSFRLINALEYANTVLYKNSTLSSYSAPDTEFDDLLNKLFSSSSFSSDSPDDISDYIQQVIMWLKDISTIRYTVSFKPRHQFVYNLYTWTKKNIQDSCLIEIDVSPEILGGVKMTANGRYYDLCLQKDLDQYFTSKKDAILSILQK